MASERVFRNTEEARGWERNEDYLWLQMGIGLFAAIIAATLSLATIAVAWLAYRPLLGIGLLVVAAGLFVGLKSLGRKKRLQAPAASPG